MPLVLPLTWAVLQANGMANPENYSIIYSTVACVLASSVWGDHCSPISDTTILSSMASGSDHVAHVRTQRPYALFVGGVALLIGTMPAGFGFPWWLSFPIGSVVLWAAAHRNSWMSRQPNRAQVSMFPPSAGLWDTTGQ